MCGFCNVWVCVCVGFVMCGCVYVCVYIYIYIYIYIYDIGSLRFNRNYGFLFTLSALRFILSVLYVVSAVCIY